MTRPQLFSLFGQQYLLPTWYPSVLVTGLAVLDSGRRLFGTPVTPVPVPPLEHATIVIAKPDHFGDLIQVTTLLRALRERLPAARLVLVHGSWAQEAANWLVAQDYVHHLVTYDAAWLQPAGTPWPTRLQVEKTTRESAARALRALHPAVYLDIRCGTPSTLDLAVESGATMRVGFGLRGRGWEYHARIRYDVEESLGQNWLHALDALGLPPARYDGPTLPAAPAPASDAPIIVQPGSRTPAKEAPLAFWEAVLPRLAELAPVQLVGNASDRARFAPLCKFVPADRLRNSMGTTSFGDLITLVGRGRAAIGVESMVAHIAVGHHRPTVVLNNPAASGRIAFPNDGDTLLFTDITASPHAAAECILTFFSRVLT